MPGSTPPQILQASDLRVLESKVTLGDFRIRLRDTQMAIHESQNALRRSDDLILTLSRLMVGIVPEGTSRPRSAQIEDASWELAVALERRSE